MTSRPTIVVLAAGQGGRSRQPRLPFDQALAGATVLGMTLRHAIQTRLPVVVVTTEPRVRLVADQLARRDIVVLGEAEARQGLGHALAAGVMERARSPGWLALPGDMPMVQPSTLLAVAAALQHHAVAIAQHGGRRGHPAAFAAELYSELAKLSGDDGTRRLVARYPAFAAEVDDPGVLAGLDTETDLDAVRFTGA